METVKKKKKIFPIVLITVVIIGIIFGFSKYLYSLHHEETDDAQIDNDISPVISRITGYISEIRFEENQSVKKGDTLVLIDNRDLLIKLSQAVAALENAKATLSVAESNVSTAIANYETAKSNAESAKIKVWKSTQDFVRFQNLINEKAVTQQQFDATKAEKETAEAQQQIATKQQSAASSLVDAAKKQILVANAMINQKQVDVDFAKLQMTFATILAPANGIASKKNIQLGQLVNGGTPLFAIVADSNLYVVANFKETQLEKMNKGNSVDVILDAFPKTKFEGTVYSFSAVTGAKFSLLPPDNATGNFVKVVQRIPVKIALKVSDAFKDKLRPGMSVKVSVRID